MTRAKSTSSSSGGSTTEEKYQHLGYHQKRTAPTGGTRKIVKALCTRILLLVVIPAIVVIAAFCWLRATGLNARGNPGAMESRLASALQRWAIPRGFRELNNPMQATPELLVEARRPLRQLPRQRRQRHDGDGTETLSARSGHAFGADTESFRWRDLLHH
jgi:hypothetical protein